MLKLILGLLERLGNRSQSKTETKVEVNVQQKITVVTINVVDNER